MLASPIIMLFSSGGIPNPSLFRLCDSPSFAFVPPGIASVAKRISLQQQNGVRNVGGIAKPVSIFSDKEEFRSRLHLLQGPRIAIVGGGIAGVTAAHALAKRLQDRASIVVYEGDNPTSDQWVAATAKNANSMVPGAAMHVMSQRRTLWNILVDTITEGYMIQWGKFYNGWMGNMTLLEESYLDKFEHPPPYFAFHPIRCLGPSASWDERKSFARFLYHFIKTSLMTGSEEAGRRGKYMVRLAKANREAFLHDIDRNEDLQQRIGLNHGFVSLHRTPTAAEHALNETIEVGEEAKLLTAQACKALDPSIDRLGCALKSSTAATQVPRYIVQKWNQQTEAGDNHVPLYGVQRLNDHTASCAAYVRDLVKRCHSLGVEYVLDGVTTIKRAEGSGEFEIESGEGKARVFDYVVLAAGVETPLFAQQVGAGRYCPTYPLRGYSLTLMTEAKDDTTGKYRTPNLMKTPISFDNMYFTSVGPNMVRGVGFGELVGYRNKAVDVPSVAPRILARYVRTLFPKGKVMESQATQCFRPISPDDIPMVGAVTAVPGLFLHTGHGTLGWSTCLATSECLAQDICEYMFHGGGSYQESFFELPDGTKIDRKVLSPDRF